MNSGELEAVTAAAESYPAKDRKEILWKLYRIILGL